MRWKPTPAQINLALDCSLARVPIERAAELLGIKPRTMRSFLKRIAAARAHYKPPPRNGAENAPKWDNTRPPGASA